MSNDLSEKNMKKYYIIWIGQIISRLGSAISSFGLVVWIYQTTGSATSFAVGFLLNVLPRIILAPISGSVADRNNRKKIIIITDVLDAILKLSLVFVIFGGRLNIWIIYFVIFTSKTLGAFQGPAFNAVIPLIVPKDSLGKANGLNQLLIAVIELGAPVIAGSLYGFIGLSGLFIFDFFTFFVAIMTVATQKIPHKIELSDDKKIIKNAINDVKFTVNYISKMSGFWTLILSISVLNFFANFAMVLLGPLVLSNYSEKIYGLVESSFGIALLVGGLIASVIPAKTNKMRKMFIGLLLCGFGFFVIGFSPLWYVIGFGVFLFGLPLPFVNGTFGAFTQLKIESKALGRVGSMTAALGHAMTPVAVILSGVLADKFFNPLLVNGGSLSNTIVGKLIGVGEVRGIGLMFIITGAILILYSLFILLNKDVMNMEYNIPDAVEE